MTEYQPGTVGYEYDEAFRTIEAMPWYMQPWKALWRRKLQRSRERMHRAQERFLFGSHRRWTGCYGAATFTGQWRRLDRGLIILWHRAWVRPVALPVLKWIGDALGLK